MKSSKDSWQWRIKYEKRRAAGSNNSDERSKMGDNGYKTCTSLYDI